MLATLPHSGRTPISRFAPRMPETIAALGLKIPKQIALVGFDELLLADVFNPPLTVVRQPAYEVGKCAAELLLKRIEDPTRPATSLKLLPELIIRKSC